MASATLRHSHYISQPGHYYIIRTAIEDEILMFSMPLRHDAAMIHAIDDDIIEDIQTLLILFDVLTLHWLHYIIVF